MSIGLVSAASAASKGEHLTARSGMRMLCADMVAGTTPGLAKPSQDMPDARS